jgi:plastocyanin
MRPETALLLAAVLAMASADVYLHSPRGQNDRCDEKSNDRNNEQRMYNSQNNAAGGYSWPDQEMAFYTSTDVRIEWYSQHACGNGESSNKADTNNPEIDQCQIILQLGCENDMTAFAGPNQATYRLTDGMSLGRPCVDRPTEECVNGDRTSPFNTFGDTCTETAATTISVTTPTMTLNAQCPNGYSDNPTCNNLNLASGTGTFNGNTCQCSTRKLKTYGLHEPEWWWLMCRARDRNRGLWLSAQNNNINNNQGATTDRQEPNSARYGFECPEEKDYYPYWHPTPWRDLAVLTSNMSMCSFYQTQSQNVMDKCMCISTGNNVTLVSNATAFYYNNQLDCQGAGFTWTCFGNWQWTAPDCLLAPHQPDNRLGNVDNRGDANSADIDAFAHYIWTIPDALIPTGQDSLRCLIRLRYNISTHEVVSNFDSTMNGAIKQNPVRTYGVALIANDTTQTVLDTVPVRMAINTAQYGRTFEDRTYIFSINRRPSQYQGATILNVNARGKRGNIAQVRNCLEYDFVPNNLQANVGDYIHFQWALSDYNNNGNSGEGRDGTDRVNVVEVSSFDGNLPRSINATSGVFNGSDLAAIAWINQQPSDCFSTLDSLTTQAASNEDPRSCHYLNGPRDPTNTLMPTAYFSYLAQVQNTGTFTYMCSRNNNFSNRSQKGTIIANPGLGAGAIAGIVVGSVAGVAAIGAAAFLFATKKISFSGKKFANRV